MCVRERDHHMYVSHLYICTVRNNTFSPIKLHLQRDKIENGRMEVTSLQFQ